MIIIFYDNCTSFKKSKLTYKLILSKQKQDSKSNPVLVSASIYSEWLVAFLTAMSHILWSWTQPHRNGVRFLKHPQNVSRSFRCSSPTFHFWALGLVSCLVFPRSHWSLILTFRLLPDDGVGGFAARIWVSEEHLHFFVVEEFKVLIDEVTCISFPIWMIVIE